MFKKFLFPVVLAASALLPLSSFGQESGGSGPTTSTIVDTSTIQSTIISAVGPWLLIGLGVGISVVVVWVGWSWIKKFIKTK